jgi:hypothetical protein
MLPQLLLLLLLLVLFQGVLDLSGSSPRRYLFQVLSQFTSHALHKERLEYFATAEGRDDLYRWIDHGEGRARAVRM